MNLNDLFFELSNKVRYELLTVLSNKPLKHSELSLRLNIPKPEVTRHIKRLAKLDLIFKNTDNRFNITQFGKLVVENLGYYEFLIKFKNFINSHCLDFIPTPLKLQLGKLRNAKISSHTMENIEIWSQIIKKAKKYIWAITDQLQYSIIPIIQQKLTSHQLEIKSILDTKLLNRLVNTEEWEIYIEGPKPEVFEELYKLIGIPNNIRKLDDTKLSIIITESDAILFLSNDKGIDYSECLYTNDDPQFLDWAIKLFNHYWSLSKAIKMNEILPK
ncbi:MAG: helix-turn-helix transcriptional regulator [Candidatus Helarchaeota archaeon]